MAVDGNKNSDNFSHTNDGSGKFCRLLICNSVVGINLLSCQLFPHVTPTEGQWWQVDLQSSISISGVTIYNRGNCCKERLSDTTVLLLDKNDDAVGIYRIGDASTSDEIEISISQFTLPPKVSAVPSLLPSQSPSFTISIFRNGLSDNLCMDVKDGNASNSNAIQLWTCNSSNSQKWYLDSLGLIHSTLDGNKCVGNTHGADGNVYAKLIIFDCRPDFSHQQWEVMPDGRIRNKHFGRYIGVANGCSGVSKGKELEIQESLSIGGNCELQQEWIIDGILPSIMHSNAPSETHSAIPSLLPSQSPSFRPSHASSLTPSTMHSDPPSETHSAIPSLSPSQSLSTNPSQTKSITPSIMHSNAPSETHSASPSLLPSQSPSTNPSQTKSITPSIMRSNAPSETHSASPSTLQSQSPSFRPSHASSLTPSTMHSDPPSETHSAIPSLLPSKSMSTNPSQTKSITPSIMYSNAPSETHSASPSTLPSQGPSFSPTPVPPDVRFVLLVSYHFNTLPLVFFAINL
eukprot:scaffold64960_cov44-Cyclotella_meneghiniana.AAC.1